jgi:hypothetical protein
MQTNNQLIHQQNFISLLRKQIPGQINLAKDISEVLEISIDGAYRRLRSETAFSLDETVKICVHYSIPLEALNNEVQDVVTFQYTRLERNTEHFKMYFDQLIGQLAKIKRHEGAHIYYAAEDIRMFYHFGFQHLGLFKMFYWMKSIMNIPEFDASHFSSDFTEGMSETFPALYNGYATVSSTEIWTNETIESTLQQVKFYWEAGFFQSTESAVSVLNDISSLLQRVSRQAEIGQKILFNGASSGIPFNLYLCDLMIGSNSIYVTSDSLRTTFIGYNTFNTIRTRNEVFNTQHAEWLDNLRSKSIQVSGMAEKIRNQFFKAQMGKVDVLKEQIENEQKKASTSGAGFNS